MKKLEIDIRLPLDRFALRVDLSCSGPVTGIFGASGAGKTSLLETVAGLRRGAHGRIRLGEEIWLDSEAGEFLPIERRRVGYVPQDGLLFPHLSVRENLLAGSDRALSAGRSAEDHLSTVAPLLELEPLLERSVGSLSGGERQRVALGRALCSAPQVLLLDEPFASLDLPLRRRLLPQMQRVFSELTVPALLVSHDPIEVQALCDEIVVLDQGTEVAVGRPHEVLTDPAVFPLARREGFENLLPGNLERSEEGALTVSLGSGSGEPRLIVAGSGGGEGPVLVGLAASQILIATESPKNLSARNVLEARVRRIRSLGGVALVTAEIGDGLPPLVVEVTAATPAQLGFAVGDRVYLVVKATSCRLYHS